MSEMHFAHYNSPLGRLVLVADSTALKEIRLPRERSATDPPANWTPGGAVLQEAVAQLQAYFRGELRMFDLPLAPVGTAFQQQVWEAVRRIEYGTTLSYGELAARLGRPSAARAVGAANGRNPLPIVIPCHRVIGHDGKLTGYAGGLPRKERLLRLEGAPCLC